MSQAVTSPLRCFDQPSVRTVRVNIASLYGAVLVSTAVLLRESLANYVEELKKSFKEYHECAKKLNEEALKAQNVFLAESSEPTPAVRMRKRRKFFDEVSSEDEQTLEKATVPSKGKQVLEVEEPHLMYERKMLSSFNSIRNALLEDVGKRLTVYREFVSKFDFLTK